jgi:hypothetical protein
MQPQICFITVYLPLFVFLALLRSSVLHAQTDQPGIETMAGKSGVSAPRNDCADYPGDISTPQTLYLDPDTIYVAPGGEKLCGNWSVSSGNACGSTTNVYKVPRRGWSQITQRTCPRGKEFWEVAFGGATDPPSKDCKWKGDDYSDGSVRDCSCSVYWPSGACQEELCYVCKNGEWKERRRHIPIP